MAGHGRARHPRIGHRRPDRPGATTPPGGTDPPVVFPTYVEEDQEAQGPAPSVEGQPRQASQHGPRLILLTTLRLSTPSPPWRRLGIPFVSDDRAVVDGITLVFFDSSSNASGLVGWGFAPDERHGVGDTIEIDGIGTEFAEPFDGHRDDSPIVGIDHVVVMTSSIDRTSGRIADELGLPLKRIRDAGGGVRQGFHRAGSVVLEVVERPDHRGPTALWGLVFTVADIDGYAAWLGPDAIGAPRVAVQPGRSIATVKDAVGLGCAVAIMSPDPRRA